MSVISAEVFRFQEVLSRWLTDSEAMRGKVADHIAAHLKQVLPSEIAAPGGVVDAPVARQIQSTVRVVFEQELLPGSAAWLRDAGFWQARMDDRVQQDVGAILNSLPPMPLPVMVDRQPVPPGRWAFAALTGGLIGGLLLPWPLSVGGLGATLCSAGLVWNLGYLANTQPMGGQRRAGQVWLARLGLHRAVDELRSLMRPEGSALAAAALVSALEPSVRDHLLVWGELILAGFWTHPARLPSEDDGDSNDPPPPPEPMNLWFAIRQLEATLKSQKQNADDPALHELVDTSDEVVQRFVDEGYEWKTPALGEVYSDDLRKLFRPFGRVNPNDHLILLEPALLKKGKLIKSGCVRSGEKHT